MPLAKGYSLVELSLTLAISSLLLLSASSLLLGLHQQVTSELKQAQLMLQAQKINERLRAEFYRAGFGVSEAVRVTEQEFGFGYLSHDGYERLAIRSEDNKLKLCRDTQAEYSPIASVCDEVTKFSMLNDRLISLQSLTATQVGDHGVHLEYQLRLKGQSETHTQSLLLLPLGAAYE